MHITARELNNSIKFKNDNEAPVAPTGGSTESVTLAGTLIDIDENDTGIQLTINDGYETVSAFVHNVHHQYETIKTVDTPAHVVAHCQNKPDKQYLENLDVSTHKYQASPYLNEITIDEQRRRVVEALIQIRTIHRLRTNSRPDVYQQDETIDLGKLSRKLLEQADDIINENVYQLKAESITGDDAIQTIQKTVNA